MKKILITVLLIPILTIIIALTTYNIELNDYLNQEEHPASKNNKINELTTEVFIIGTTHFETDAIKRHHFYQYLDSISPTVILYEGDSSTVRRIVKKTDYFSRFMDAFKKGKRVEKPVVLKYLKNNPDCMLLPYEWELRNKYHRKHKLRKRSKEMLNMVIRLYRDSLLTKDQSEIVHKFLNLNNTLLNIDNGTVKDLNNITTDSILKKRQHYVYKDIPEIAKERKELVKYYDFIPIHMSYWDTRNKAMAQNILKQIQHNPNKTIVVLTGSYHRYYLIEELKQYESDYDFSVKSI
ncbi:hypothetical protein [uncultured Psychroserpens sp.]|uniref:hypothetical protein n=1 Tax=uncultured Psychroserpens sp. TaxID=255436 RepID=UPI002602FF09|nr:hypothetical protein [uncultured Psychroserpens sp.]